MHQLLTQLWLFKFFLLSFFFTFLNTHNYSTSFHSKHTQNFPISNITITSVSDNIVHSSMETLPVEVLHRIFDNLDTETIFVSIRPLSRLFRSVVNTYHQYNLNMKLISKSNFHLISDQLLCFTCSSSTIYSTPFINSS
jgi:hypothetical protein